MLSLVAKFTWIICQYWFETFCLLLGLVLSPNPVPSSTTPLHFKLGPDWTKQSLIESIRNDPDVLEFLLKQERFEKRTREGDDLNSVWVNDEKEGYIYQSSEKEIKVSLRGKTHLLFVTADEMKSELEELKEKSKPLSFPHGTTIDQMISDLKRNRYRIKNWYLLISHWLVFF